MSAIRVMCGGLFGLAFLILPMFARGDDPPNSVEVQARGQIHEAYAEPIEQQPGPGPIIPKQPPEPVDELPPDQKPEGDNIIWLPGYWSYDDERKDFIWVSGFWRATPPNRVWMPGSWRKLDAGFQWVGGFWGKAEQEKASIEYLPEPPKPLELAPATPAPAPTSVYVPGAWIYRGRYVWRPGYWVDYRPNWIWIPAHYRWTPAGYVFVDGYWDYTLQDRGILYAPVYIPSGIYLQANYVYTPTVVVREQCVFGALFVRRGYGAYYFGDYFAPGYATTGYVSWCGYGGGGAVVVGFYDPMYSYYRVSYRDDPYWRGGIVNLYVGRYRGDIPPPPRTLVQQNNIFVNNTTVNNTTVINNKTVNVSNVQMLTTVNQVAKTNTNIKITNISMAARQEQGQSARQLNQVAQSRNVAETQMVAKNGGAMPKLTDAPRTSNLAVPKSIVRASSATPNHTANIIGKTNDLHLPPGGNAAPKNPVLGKIDPKRDPITIPGKTPATQVDPKTGLQTHTDPKTGMTVHTDPKTGMTVHVDPRTSPIPPVPPKLPPPPPRKDPPRKKDKN